jgi:hypothetical protein
VEPLPYFPAARDEPPWAPGEVASLNGYQHSGAAHPFTCRNDVCRGTPGLSRYAPLRAAEDGWYCDHCGYTQNWAFVFMTDWSWLTPGPWPLIIFTAAC